ncbi:MAG TPA: 4-hydroxyphenylpyruvate dioxygenase [Vicinamibacterales bacterium]|jgi:4-hydroxyphenylpyruvate dioxygenase
MDSATPAPAFETVTDVFPINGTDYIEFYVGNARQAAHYYQTTFGFEVIGYSGPETGVRDRASYLLRQNKVRFIVTAAMGPDGPIADHVRRHGDGIRDIALWVDDAREAYALAVARGARSAYEPRVLRDGSGEVVMAGIHTYGDTIHSLVERRGYRGAFRPDFQPMAGGPAVEPVGILHVDHCVGNVELGKMDEWVGFYERVMGFRNLISFDDEDISTEYSSLMSKVVANGNERIKFPINEPAEGRRKSQIDEYLDYYGGAGAQHLALATHDIVHTVRLLEARGLEFLTVPSSYYETLLNRVGPIEEDLRELKQLGILVDRDDEGYLLQIFTQPVQDRPTFFYEIIQRKGARSFGKGNFKALFEAIEREQARRGNL